MKNKFTILEFFNTKPHVRAKFEAFIDRSFHPMGCWIWTGCMSYLNMDRDSNNPAYRYGCVMNGLHLKFPVARISWVLHHNQEWPTGFLACHSCDNRRCVNPDHIWVGTHKQNMQDRAVKGLGRSGKIACPTGEKKLWCVEKY